MPYSNPNAPGGVPLLNQGPRGTTNQFLQNAQQAWAANPLNNGAAPAANPADPASGAAPPPTDPQYANSNPTMENPSLSQYGFLDPNAWQNWQQYGGPVDTQGQYAFLNQNHWTQGGADPTHVDPTSASGLFGAAQPYEDAAYQAATRSLDPQWQQNQAAFDQEMVNRGIPPGSDAYNQAKASLDQSRNDAYSQARSDAMGQGLQAQAQGFGQGLSQSQLASQLAQSLIGANTSTTNQILGGNNSLFNQLIGGNVNLSDALLGLQGSMYGAQSSAGASRANTDANYRLGQQQLQQTGQQQDFTNMMSLLGLGMGTTQYNNGLLDQQQHNNMAFFPYMPSSGAGNIDVQGPYNQQYQGQMGQYGIDQQNANAQNQAMMSAAMMAFMMCSRDFKEPLEVMPRGKSLQAVMSLPVNFWRYKGQDDIHVGTYAEDFNDALGLPQKPVIHPIDMLGAILGAVQDLSREVSDIKQRLAVAGA